MRGKQVAIEWQDTVESLREVYLAERVGRVRSRLQLLWLVRGGMTVKEAVVVVGVHYRTGQEWIRWYREGGLAEVRRRAMGNRHGHPRRLSAEQEAELVEQAKTEGFTTHGEAADWIKQRFGVSYKSTGLGRVFDRLELRRKVPRPRHVKAVIADQEAWKRGA